MFKVERGAFELRGLWSELAIIAETYGAIILNGLKRGVGEASGLEALHCQSDESRRSRDRSEYSL